MGSDADDSAEEWLEPAPSPSIASFILLFLLSSTSSALAGWLNDLVQVSFVASVALLVESGGAMFVSGSRWEQRPNRLLTTLGRLLALLVTVGMVTV